MGTEQFSYVKPVVASGENVVPQAQAFGQQVTATNRPNSPGSAIQPAGLFSTAPYEPPKPKKDLRAGRCVGNDNTCGGWAIKESDLCVAHARSAGVITWSGKPKPK